MSQVPASLTARSVDRAAAETAIDSSPGNRRQTPRHPALPGAKVEVRPWGGGPGPDVAVELLDVSELGVRVRLSLPVRVSDRFEVTLRDAEGTPWAKVMAVLCWSTRSPDGTVVAGLALGRPLLPDVVRRLAGPPIIPARAPAGSPPTRPG